MFDFDISMFGFVALWSPIFLVSAILCILLYLMVKRREQNTKKILFILGVILFYIFLGSPIDLLGHLIFSFHMVQMAGVFFIAIPLILFGLTEGDILLLFGKKINDINSLLLLGLFNIVFSLYHLPIIFDYVMTHRIMHSVMQVLLIVTCFFMWYPLIYKHMNPIKKIGYIFANGVLLTPSCALIIFSSKELYGIYTDPFQWSQMMKLCVPMEILSTLNLQGPYFFKWISPVEDQQLGGVLMKIIQEIVLGSFIGYVFITGFKKDRKIDRIEDIHILSR